MNPIRAGFEAENVAAPVLQGMSSVGSLGNGLYRYAVTHVTRFGETLQSTSASIVVPVVGARPIAGASVKLTGLVAGGFVSAVRVYRTAVGGAGVYRRVAELGPAVGVMVDVLADADLGALAPIADTSLCRENIHGHLLMDTVNAYAVDRVVATGVDLATAASLRAKEYIFVTGTGGVHLPPVDGMIGQKISLISQTLSAVTVYARGADMIGGLASVSLSAGATLTLLADNVGSWIQLASGGGGGGAPTGPAGGDLTGTYPSPSLVAVGVAGTYGNAGNIPIVTVDGKGRVTSVTTAAVGSSLSMDDSAAGVKYPMSLGGVWYGNGTKAGVAGASSTAIGNGATALFGNAVALGASAVAGVANGLALGAGAVVNAASNALGLGVNAASVFADRIGVTINGVNRVIPVRTALYERVDTSLPVPIIDALSPLTTIYTGATPGVVQCALASTIPNGFEVRLINHGPSQVEIYIPGGAQVAFLDAPMAGRVSTCTMIMYDNSLTNILAWEVIYNNM